MGESHLAEVRRQLLRHLAVGERPVAVFGHAPPRAEVQLVDRGRVGERRRRGALRHPLRVVPLMVRCPHYRSGPRRRLGVDGKGVGLVHLIAVVPRRNVILVGTAHADARKESLPDPRRTMSAERMTAGIPGVEVADHADARRRRGPDGKPRSRPAADPGRVRAELFPQPAVRALVEEMQVLFTQRRRLVPYRCRTLDRGACPSAFIHHDIPLPRNSTGPPVGIAVYGNAEPVARNEGTGRSASLSDRGVHRHRAGGTCPAPDSTRPAPRLARSGSADIGSRPRFRGGDPDSTAPDLRCIASGPRFPGRGGDFTPPDRGCTRLGYRCIDFGNDFTDFGDADIDRGGADIDRGDTDIDREETDIDRGDADIDWRETDIDSGDPDIDSRGVTLTARPLISSPGLIEADCAWCPEIRTECPSSRTLAGDTGARRASHTLRQVDRRSAALTT